MNFATKEKQKLNDIAQDKYEDKKCVFKSFFSF